MRFFGQQFINCFPVHLIGHAAVNRTNGGTLWLFVETLALGTLIGGDIIHIYSYRGMGRKCIGNRSVHKGIGAFYSGTICNSPFYTAFIDRVIRTFRFTGAAVDTFIGASSGDFWSCQLVERVEPSA